MTHQPRGETVLAAALEAIRTETEIATLARMETELCTTICSFYGLDVDEVVARAKVEKATRDSIGPPEQD